MAKQVTITKLTLVNFKGLRNVTVEFTGSQTTISGRNGSGKTTIADGFCWVLWGKDSEGNSDTKFGIKTTDKAGQYIPHLDHEGTVTLQVTDTETGETETKVFRRVFQEEWKETTDPNTGETSEFLKGHHTNYYFNEMPLKTKGEYDKQVAEVMPEDLFKVITNPRHFLTLPWKTQRDILLQMAGAITDEQVIASDAKFGKLVELLAGKTVEGFKEMLKENRNLVERDLQRIPTRIDEVTRNTPADLDFTALEQERAELLKQLEEADAAVTSVATAIRQQYERQSQRQQRINELLTQQRKIEFDAKDKAQREAYEKNAAHTEAYNAYQLAQANYQRIETAYETESDRKETKKKYLLQDIERTAAKQDTIRENWFTVNGEQFADGSQLICPLFQHGCGDQQALQQYNADQQAAREKYYADKEARLNAITKEGKQLGAVIAAKQQEVDAIAAELDELKAKFVADADKANAAVEAAMRKLQETPATNAKPEPFNPEAYPLWQSAQEEIDRLRTENEQEPQAGTSDNAQEYRKQRAAIQEKLDAVKADLAKREQIANANKRIAELNEQKKALQQKKAQLQGNEDLIADFEKEKMNEVERRVNGLFTIVRFKMYRTQIEDAKEVPDCIAYIDGVKYADKNNAGKINAGLDVINALCAFHKVSAPIFIDNAESVNTFIPTASQLVQLVVTKGNLTVTNK